MAQSYLQTASVSIVGTRPLLWHHFTSDALGKPGERKVKEGAPGNNPEEWRRTVLVTPEGRLYVLPTYIFGALCEGAKASRKGVQVRSSVQVLDSIILTNCTMPEEPLPVLEECPDAPVYLDIRGVKLDKTKSRHIRYRIAAAPGWTCSFQIAWDTSQVSVAEMQRVVTDAGTLAGLGDGRQIGFGRFEIADFQLK